MKRSAGVTASAVIVFIGSTLVLLLGALSLLGVALASPSEGQPHFFRYIMWFFLALMFGGAGWGIATGVGLLLLEDWGRISILIFSGLLLFFGIPGLLMDPFMPIQQSPGLPGNFVLFMRISLAVFYGILAALGVWWMIFFTRKSVRAQFQGTPEYALQPPASPARPISITIIGWYLLISAFISVFFLFIHIPIFLLGFMINGWASSLFMLGCGIVQLVMGAGLLKLKPWCRILAIGYFSFFTFNEVLMVVIPGSEARYEQAMKSVQESWGLPQTPMQFPVWFGLVVCVPLFGVLLWFLITCRRAFLPQNQVPAPLG